MNLTSAVFSGNTSLLVHCAESYLDAGHAIRTVVTDRPAIARWAEGRNIAVVANDASLAGLPNIAFDFLFSLAGPCRLPSELSSRAQTLAMCFHDSLSPRHAGQNAPTWALASQATDHGVAWREITPSGEGRLVGELAFDIAAGETALSLQARCYEAGLASFQSIIDDIGRGTLVLAEPVSSPGVVDCQLRSQALGTLDLSRPASELACLVGALDFGPYPNPVARAKLYLGDRTLLVCSASLPVHSSGAAPGTVLKIDAQGLRIATGQGDIVLGGCTPAWGMPAGEGIVPGMVLPALDGRLRDQLAARSPEISQGEAFWRRALTALAPVELPYPHKAAALQHGPRQWVRARLGLPACGMASIAGFFAWLSALSAQRRISLLYCDSVLTAGTQDLEAWLSPWVPLTLEIALESPAQQATDQAMARIAGIHQAGPCPRDLPSRLGTRAGSAGHCGRIGVSMNSASAPAGVDLILTADPADQCLELIADEAVFSSETLQVMSSHLGAYLKAFPVAGRLDALPLVPEKETAAMALLNATSLPYPAGLGIHEAIAAQAARTPERIAVSFAGQTLSYRELDDRASALATRLVADGAQPGDIIGLCLARGPDLLAGALAILKTGAAYLPLDSAYPHDRLAYMIEDSGTPRVVTSRALADALALPADQVFVADEPDAPACRPRTEHRPRSDAQRLAYLIYTSGSTGRPKGVAVTHRNVMNLFAGLDARIPHDPPGRWLACASLSFDMSVPEVWWTLARGFTVVLHANALPNLSVPQTILEGKVTHLQCTPSMASMLVADTAGRKALSCLSVLMVGAEALPVKLARELRSLVPGPVFNLYGPTETTVWSTACELADTGEFVSLGQPIANTHLVIRTPLGAEAPALVAGELLIGGDGVTDGYWRRPEQTADRFVADPARPGARLYRTGDLVRRHPGGAIEFLGRIDHQVKIRGHRIELGEIENVLLRQKGVKDAVVMAREDAAGDWALAAYVTPQAGAALDTDLIRRSLSEKLPAIMVPRMLMALRAFPLSPNGKVDRRALPLKRPAADLFAGIPRTRLEKALVAVWEQVLGQAKVGVSDNFFDLGGSFFRAVQVQRRLQERHGCQVSLGALVRFPTIQAFGAHLAETSPHTLEEARLCPQDLATCLPAAASPANEAWEHAAADKSFDPVESTIARLWRDLLGIDNVTVDDDFFALGGHSLTAVRLFAQIKHQFAVDLPLATLFEAPTIAALAAVVRQNSEPQTRHAANDPAMGALPASRPAQGTFSALVTICKGHPGRRPLFFIHGAGGNVLNYKIISDRLGPEQPFYGLQAQGVDGRLPFLTTIEAMAAQYVAAVRTVDPHGPYQLAGFSGGGVIAFEMAQQLSRAGAKVALLGMIDTICPTAEQRRIPLLKRLWLMRHWSLRFALERSERRKKDRYVPTGAIAGQSVLEDDELPAQEVADFYLFRNYLQAQDHYRPQPYSGPMLLFKATQAATQYLAAGKCLGWEEHIQGNIRVIPIEGSHLAMMVKPGVEKVVQGFESALVSPESTAAVQPGDNVSASPAAPAAAINGKRRAA